MMMMMMKYISYIHDNDSKGCPFMNNDNINDNTIEDNGYDGYFQETEEDDLNIKNHQVNATNFEVLLIAHPIRLRNGSKVTSHWVHYPEIAKFGELFCLFINIISNFYFYFLL